MASTLSNRRVLIFGDEPVSELVANCMGVKEDVR